MLYKSNHHLQIGTGVDQDPGKGVGGRDQQLGEGVGGGITLPNVTLSPLA